MQLAGPASKGRPAKAGPFRKAFLLANSKILSILKPTIGQRSSLVDVHVDVGVGVVIVVPFPAKNSLDEELPERN